MSWTEKRKPTPFDNKPIEGLWFLDGDIVAALVGRDWTKGDKYPVIVFPSGKECDLWESGDPNNAGIVHLFGEADLRYNSTRDEAHKQAQYIAEQCGYYVEKVGENQLKLVGHDSDEHLIVTYDNEEKRMVDVAPIKDEPYERPVHPAHILMTDEIKEKLPDLYSNEEIGLDAIALVKYFHVLSNWTWYASEYREDEELGGIFFGLVVGFAVEFGLFTLSELEEIGKDGRTLPVERDLYYQPKTLKELKEMHEQQRGE
jgi:hypothetical protein